MSQVFDKECKHPEKEEDKEISGDGLQEVIACSWDGQTYIISQDRQAVRFEKKNSAIDL